MTHDAIVDVVPEKQWCVYNITDIFNDIDITTSLEKKNYMIAAICICGTAQGWQVLPMPGFNHGLNPGLNRVGQNSKNPVTVGKTGQNVIKF